MVKSFSAGVSWSLAFFWPVGAALASAEIFRQARLARPSVLAAPCARSFARKPWPSKIEGAGKTGCAPHPRSRAQCLQRKAAPEHTGLAEASGLPCAMALRLIRDRPGDRLSCHHRPQAALAAFELDASTGASDPHDFTVRKGYARQSRPRVHRIPPHGRDDRDRPSCRGRRAESYG